MALFVYPPVTVDTTGLATEAKQDAMIALLTSLDGKDYATQTTLQLLEDRLPGGLVPETFDYQALTYVAAGNGAGEVETVTYRTGGAAGTIVATVTLTYDANDNVATVTVT